MAGGEAPSHADGVPRLESNAGVCYTGLCARGDGERLIADVPSLPPGAKIAVIEGPVTEPVPFTFRLKLPANYKIPAHSHPAIEHVTVISGAFNLGMGDKFDSAKTKPLSPGSVAIMQPKTNHFGWTKEEAIVQVHGVGPWGLTYVNPADDPRKK